MQDKAVRVPSASITDPSTADDAGRGHLLFLYRSQTQKSMDDLNFQKCLALLAERIYAVSVGTDRTLFVDVVLGRHINEPRVRFATVIMMSG